MKKHETIKSKNDFSNIINTSKYIKTDNFIIYYKANDLSKTRFGIAISNKIGKANIRNKLKRQTREIILNTKNLFKNNTDYIIMIRKRCLETTFHDRLNEINEILRRNNEK